MAEQIPYGVIVSIINRLASSAFHEFGRIYGVRDELESLNKTLESIKVVLSDAEQRQDQDPTIGHWIRRFKELLHDADDLLDELAIKDMRLKVNDHSKVVNKVRGLLLSENPLAFRVKLARKIEKIRKKFSDVAEDMSKLKLNPSLVVFKQYESSWRETSSFVLESSIIGREENKIEIIELLMQTNTNQNVSLIAIVGMGGLGKTALAQLAYNDAQVQKLFDKFMWVCISEDFEVKSVLNKILKSLKNDGVGDLDLDILQKKLREELNGQRYMLVLDDVWNENQLKWNDLRTYLMCGGQGSKILVTTRSTMVSQIMGVNNPYVLKGLNKEQSWTLLKKLTFGEDASKISPNLKSIGEKIAKKCGGVPLAIRTMGGFLQTINKEEDQWLSILNGDVWRLCEERQSIMPVLRLSYQNLPLGLRQCFAYCCLYPKDWKIEKDELIRLWMAQGYLESSIESQSMEDVGNQYVKILLMRSFFQDASLSKNNDIVSFKMHDLMYDLAKSVAGNDCYLHSEGKGIIGRPMHASFISSTVCSLDLLDASKPRTILWAKTIVGSVLDAKPSIIKNLKSVRVLDLSYSSITKLPQSIDKCKHLRYLDLSNCKELISLPKSIGNLVSLQSLKLCGCRKLEFCTEVITKLISLRHLDIEGCKAFEDMMPLGLGQLSSLQSLSIFVVGDDEKKKCGKLNELKELNNIRGHLRISHLGLVKDVALESQEANLKAKKHIQLLELNWGKSKYELVEESKNNEIHLQLLDNLCPNQNLRKLRVSGYPGVRFSSWLPSLTNIVQIYFYRFSNCQHLPPLERLPWLKKLHISEMNELKYMHYYDISHVFFPSLERLILFDCKNLMGWQKLANDVDNHCSLPPFPRLSYLEIWDCPNLTCMPTYPYLVELRLISCNVKPLIETCLVQLHSSSFNPLSGLKQLYVTEIDVEAMPKKWMENLTSLEHLSLSGLLIIVPMLQHLRHLSAELQDLRICQVDKLDLWKDEKPHGLQSLQKISIEFCDNLKALPQQIYDLQSLRHIKILHCHNLESLPEGMQCLTNLQTLRISHCHLLRKRCQIGEDWPNIVHIPNIIID
ncbi:Virus X resistance protein-like, coiled-coil domain [Sesbania bispinosa]|nr:Virus X resistance protein-like, coiled-coil domain [Sesbania bispinosa]